MGILAHTSCYLLGPVEADPQAADWRKHFSEHLQKMGVVILDPLDKPGWVGPRVLRPQDDISASFLNNIDGDQEVANEALNAQILSRDVCLRQVNACNWAICRLPKKFTVGTIEELHILDRRGTPVFFIFPDGIPSMWLISMFFENVETMKTTCFKAEDELLARIREIDSGKVPIDPLKWIFISWAQKEKGKRV
jgi:hypothetical protein